LPKEHFIRFIVKACESRSSQEYKELYIYLLQGFTKADKKGDGYVRYDNFDELIVSSASLPRALGLVPPQNEIYKTDNAKELFRRAWYDSIAGEKGIISFDGWLEDVYRHICEKAVKFKSTLSGKPPSKMGFRFD